MPLIPVSLRQQFAALPPLVHANLAEKTVVIVGASNGIGLEAAKHFARMKPERLILACRNQARGEAALAEIREQTEYTSTELWNIDLCSFASVKSFADKYEREGGRLDILVENAAVMPGVGRSQPTEDGWDPCLQTNYIAPSLHSLLLLPRMIETAEKYGTRPRLVIVSSSAAFSAKLDKSVIHESSPLRRIGSKKWLSNPEDTTPHHYYITKLLNVLFVRELASRLRDTPIIVMAANPGYSATGLRSSFTGMRSVFHSVLENLIARSAEEGSRSVVWAATGGDLLSDDKMRGAFVSAMEVIEQTGFLATEDGKLAGERLWDDLLEELSELDPRMRPIINMYLKKSNL